MIKLNLGCGTKQIKGFINVDIRQDVDPDLVWDVSNIAEKFYEKADLIYSSHLLEHYPRKVLSQPIKTYFEVLEDWFRALKKGGELYLSVPDFQACVEHYIYHKDITKLYGLLLGGQKHDFDVHYHIFDEKTLTKDLLSVGFKKVERYDRDATPWSAIDDYSAARLDPAFSRSGKLMSLNVKATK